MLRSEVEEEDMGDEEDMETYIVNGKPVFVKKGLHPKTILAIFCQQYNLEFPVFRVSEINEYDPERRTFKAQFELEGKSVMGSARQKKEAESKAARKFLNNLFLSRESSPQAEKQVSSGKKNIPPKQTAKQNRRLEKFLLKKDQERKAREEADAEATNQASKTDLRRIVSFDLERTCGPEDSEIIQLGYCSKDYRGNSFIFPSGKIDEKASMLSHKILVRNNQLVRNREVLPTDTLQQAAEKFLQSLNKIRSEFGSPILVAHGTDHKTLINNFDTVGYDTKLCETIAGAVNFWNVIHEDEKYPASSTLSLVKLTDGKNNLAQTVLGEEISREELSEAHDGLFDAELLLRVIERYAELFTPLQSILDHHLMIASELISLVQYHMTRIRIRRKKASRFLTFYGWDGEKLL